MYKQFLLVLLFLAFVNISFSQNKAIVVQNIWNNDLNNYTPKEYLGKLYNLLKEQLAVKDVVEDAISIKSIKANGDQYKQVKDQIKVKNAAGEHAYFISIATDLRLPALNLGRFLFKNPPRSSKLTFTLHVYDSTGTEVLGDTIINRGCLVKTLDEKKGSRYFYSGYQNFMEDMQCHLDYIRKILVEKAFVQKQKQLREFEANGRWMNGESRIGNCAV